ncbi:hypothetical protein [Streptomyces sp. NPDC058612]|uniref:hypothetical protein n=1 Tax=Streptomyces sp. NPDC058612 TaxID=3346555 RepID=UPI00365E94D1
MEPFRDPHVQPAMRQMTGRDPEVIDTVLSTPGIPALVAATVQAARAFLSGPSTGPLRIAAASAAGTARSSWPTPLRQRSPTTTPPWSTCTSNGP